MIINKEYIEKISIFDYNGQIYAGNIDKFIFDSLELNIKSQLDRKMVFILTVDLLQHFSRLSEYKDSFNKFDYVLGKDSEKYYVYFSKVVSSKNIGFIDDLELINKSSLEELKELYKETLLSAGMILKKSPLKSLFLLELKRKSREDILLNHEYYDKENYTIELIISTKIGLILKNKLIRFFQQNQELAESAMTWHKERNFDFEDNLVESMEKLSNSGELKLETKLELITSSEFLRNNEKKPA